MSVVFIPALIVPEGVIINMSHALALSILYFVFCDIHVTCGCIYNSNSSSFVHKLVSSAEFSPENLMCCVVFTGTMVLVTKCW